MGALQFINFISFISISSAENDLEDNREEGFSPRITWSHIQKTLVS